MNEYLPCLGRIAGSLTDRENNDDDGRYTDGGEGGKDGTVTGNGTWLA